MKTAIIIPAAGRGNRMLNLTDNCPKAMLPISGRPLISYLLDQIIENNQKDVFIVVGYKKEVLINYVDQVYKDKLNITYIEQTELLGLNHAVYLALNEIKDFDSVFIMLSDSIFKDNSIYKFGDKSYVACKQVKDYSRWCMLDVKNNKFIDKPKEKPDTDLALLGAYYFNNLELFREASHKALFNKPLINGEYQLSSAMEYYTEEIQPLMIEEWYDFGDLTNYNINRKNFFNHRYFNDVINTNKGIFKASGSNYNKIQREIMWYLSIPTEFKKWTPKLIEYNLADYTSSYYTEYSEGNTLQELWLYSNLSNEEWKIILDKILDLLKEFKSKTNYEHTFNINEFLFNNLYYRLDINKLFNDDTHYNNLRSFKDLKNDFFNFGLKNKYPCIIHGDLTFSNIIYNINNGDLKIIDPRGDFNGNIIYGDIRYDIAKLAQCIYGDYDYIVNGLKNNKEKSLDLLEPILDHFNIDKKDILFITAIQFLTMIPLHEKYTDNMKIKALELLNEIF